MAAVLFMFTPGVLSAQSTPNIPPPSSIERLQTLFATFEAGEALQIVTPRYFVEDAHFEGVDGGTVRLSQSGTEVPLELADIRAVSVRARHSLQGALWGAGAGILVGSLAGMIVGSFDCTTASSCQDAEREGALRWGSVFGIGGAVGGFVIGRYAVYWKPVFP